MFQRCVGLLKATVGSFVKQETRAVSLCLLEKVIYDVHQMPGFGIETSLLRGAFSGSKKLCPALHIHDQCMSADTCWGIHINPVKVPQVDSNGAGDTFATAYMIALAQGHPDPGHAAAWTASRAVMAPQVSSLHLVHISGLLSLAGSGLRGSARRGSHQGWIPGFKVDRLHALETLDGCVMPVQEEACWSVALRKRTCPGFCMLLTKFCLGFVPLALPSALKNEEEKLTPAKRLRASM
eukprot:scaffold88492_cov20-Tisochrysis_lutea.AAC.1